MNNGSADGLIPLGWREWISFPDWGVSHIKAKIDTGAKTSSIHVENLEYFQREGSTWVRFTLYPWQNSKNDSHTAEAPVISRRSIRSSSGTQENRPIIPGRIKISDRILDIELSLTNRQNMGLRMLLGRDALRDGFYVIPSQSYLCGKPSKEIRLKNKGRSTRS